jgi:hypothetical protein
MHDPNSIVDKYYDASLSFSRRDEGDVVNGKSTTTTTTATSSSQEKKKEMML